MTPDFQKLTKYDCYVGVIAIFIIYFSQLIDSAADKVVP